MPASTLCNSFFEGFQYVTASLAIIAVKAPITWDFPSFYEFVPYLLPNTMPASPLYIEVLRFFSVGNGKSPALQLSLCGPHYGIFPHLCSFFSSS
jgi:hypothetical protein